MSDNPQNSLQATPEQVLYAAILEKGMFLGLLILLVTYLTYVLGILKPYIALDEIPKYWSLSVHEYLEHAHIQHGWAWVRMLGYGDFLNFIGIAMLAGVTLVCFLAIIPSLWKQNDKLYALFALLEAIILGAAASGLLGVGGH
jgi:hypothetical protein